MPAVVATWWRSHISIYLSVIAAKMPWWREYDNNSFMAARDVFRKVSKGGGGGIFLYELEKGVWPLIPSLENTHNGHHISLDQTVAQMNFSNKWMNQF